MRWPLSLLGCVMLIRDLRRACIEAPNVCHARRRELHPEDAPDHRRETESNSVTMGFPGDVIDIGRVRGVSRLLMRSTSKPTVTCGGPFASDKKSALPK